jgi:hypothetical protein
MNSQVKGQVTATVAATAVAAAALAGAGALVAEPSIETKIADVAKAGLTRLKSSDDSAFANSLREVRDTGRTGFVAMGFGN